MSAALDLVVLNGPLEGEVVQLRPSVAMHLGRSAKGLQLIDPLVSLSHARITWEGDRYWIEDLNSATGTFVNDVRLSERAVVLVPGMRIRLGETDIEVRDRPRSAMLRIVGTVASLFLLYLGVQLFMNSIEVKYEPVIRWFEPVSQGAGYTSSLLHIPESFIRETGVDHRMLEIDQVTDYDGNGIDELWLRWRDGRRVVTFDPNGNWVTLSELHMDCRQKGKPLDEGLPAECTQPDRVATKVPDVCAGIEGARGFPDLDCAGSVYRFTDDGYVPVEHKGLYAWMPPTAPINPKEPDGAQKVVEGPPQPYLFTLVREAQLAGFLAERGIVEPIHYLICSGAVPGIRAQVLTERGEVVPLSYGCTGNLSVEGPTRMSEFGDGEPLMFAFTGHGYEALLTDVAMYLSGSTDPLFMSPAQRKLYTAIASVPSRRSGAIRVGFKGAERMFNPVAHEFPIPPNRVLQATEFHDPPPPTAMQLTIDGSGRYDLAGCSELDVKVFDWHCLFTKGCGAASVFMRITSTGCGNGFTLDVPYAPGLHRFYDGEIEGRVAIESIDENGQIDVLRARMAYRPVPKDR